jgi:hypothetical protein
MGSEAIREDEGKGYVKMKEKATTRNRKWRIGVHK